MNKIFKVIYSKTRHCYVVVSELAKSHCKTTQSHTARSKTALTAAVLLALGAFSFVGMPVVQAADGTESLRNNDFVGANDQYWYYDEGDKEWKTYQYKLTSAFNNRARGKLPNYQGGGAKFPGAVTAGLYAQAGQQTVTIGDRNAGQSKGSVFIGEHSGYNNGNNDPAGMKNNYVTSVGFQSDATGWGSIAIGSNATAENSNMESQVVKEVGNANTSGTVSDDTYGIEENPTIQGASVALGYNAHSKDGNIAIGSYSDATSTDKGDSYVSVGNGTLKRRITNVAKGTDNSDVVTVGQMNDAIKQADNLNVNAGWGINVADEKDTNTGKKTKNVISLKHNLGKGYNDDEAKGMIIGGLVEDRDTTKQYGAADANSVIVGAGKALASGKSSVVVGGLDNVASGATSVVVGGDNNNAAGNQSAVFGGRDNTAGGIASTAGGGIMNVANGQQAVALGGAYNYALGVSSTAIGGTGGNGMYGYSTSVNGNYSVSLAGGSTGTDALNGLAAGNRSVVTTANGTAVGYQATTDQEGTIAFGHDAGDVSGYAVTWKQRTDGKTNADHTTNDYTQVPDSVTPTTYKDAYYNRLVKVADGQDDHDVVVMEQLKDYTKTDASNIGVHLKGADGKNAASSDKIQENEKAWGTALGTGDINTPSGMLVTDTALHNELRPANGNYVHANSTTAQNLTALDTQVGTNTTDIKNLKDLSNLTDAGKTVIKNAAKGAVKVVKGKNTTVTEGSEGDAKTYAVNVDDSAIKGAVQGDLDKKANVDATNIQGENLTKWQAALGTGAVTSGNTGLMTGGAVYNEVRPTKDGTYVKSTNTTVANLTALDTQVTTNTSDIAKNKTDIANNKTAIDNITKNVSDLSGNAVQYDADFNKQKVTLKGEGGTTIANVKDGALSDKSTDAVNGKQLFNEQQAREAADKAINDKIGTLNQNGNYILKDSSISSNLSTLDNKVKENAEHIAQNTNDIKNLKDSSSTISKEIEIKAGKDLDNITDKGKQVIKDTMKADLDKKANVDASNIETSKWADKLGTGKVVEGDKNLINGDTVHNAIHEAEGRNPVQSDGQTITIGSKDTATKIDVSGTGNDGQSTGRIITGVVTDVDDPNSAANVGYVNGLTAANTQQIYRDMNNAYSRLDTNINRAAAGSNALAALHPLDFDPADKASFAVGYGHYRNANAAAVGAFYQPNANTMVNMGISLGNGDPGFNAGVSFKIGKGSAYNGVSKAEMAQTIHDQATEISAIKADDAAKDKRIDALEKENQEMKKQIQEILARLNG